MLNILKFQRLPQSNLEDASLSTDAHGTFLLQSKISIHLQILFLEAYIVHRHLTSLTTNADKVLNAVEDESDRSDVNVWLRLN